MLSFSLVAEALTGLIYHRPSGENSKFLPSFDVGNKHELVEDVDAQTLNKLVKLLKRGNAPAPYTVRYLG